MIRAVIIDDEPNNVENLQNLIAIYCLDISIVGTAYNAANGAQLIRGERPDLLFLDIQMPHASGFDLLRSLEVIDFEIIFVTAYDHYGVQAIKFSALDYLLKPIDLPEFKAAVSKASEKILSKKQNRNLENLLEYIRSGQQDPPKLALPTLGEIIYTPIDQIVRCEASNSYTTIYLVNNERVLVCKTLKEFAELLQPHQFIRTHQSHLVNLKFVKSYLKEDGGSLLLLDGAKIVISRQNREYVKNELTKRVLG